jgi:hypothetical protein
MKASNLDLYSEGTLFEFRPAYHLSRLGSFVVLLRLPRRMQGYGNNCLVPNKYALTIQRYIMYAVQTSSLNNIEDGKHKIVKTHVRTLISICLNIVLITCSHVIYLHRCNVIMVLFLFVLNGSSLQIDLTEEIKCVHHRRLETSYVSGQRPVAGFCTRRGKFSVS